MENVESADTACLQTQVAAFVTAPLLPYLHTASASNSPHASKDDPALSSPHPVLKSFDPTHPVVPYIAAHKVATTWRVPPTSELLVPDCGGICPSGLLIVQRDAMLDCLDYVDTYRSLRWRKARWAARFCSARLSEIFRGISADVWP